MNIILFGAPAAGKGTQARKIVSEHECIQLSTGDMLRSVSRSGTEFGNEIARVLLGGELVSDEIVTRLIKEKFDQHGAQKDYVFDGFPRTIKQAESLDRLLAEYNQGIDIVLYLKVDHEILMKRIEKRYDQEHRVDDNPETFRMRLQAYEIQTKPLIAYYKKQNKLSIVNGMDEINRVTKIISETLLSVKEKQTQVVL